MADDTKIMVVDGITYSVRQLDPGDMFDLFEACSEMSGNRAWVGYASRVCSVREIDNIPVPFPRTKDDVKMLARKIGSAAMDALLEDASPTPSETVEPVVAKNYPETAVS